MLCLISILMYTQVGSVQQETRQVYTTSLRKCLHILAIIKQYRGNNERQNKTS